LRVVLAAAGSLVRYLNRAILGGELFYDGAAASHAHRRHRRERDEVIAQELSGLGEKLRDLERRMAGVERVNARLEDAALITARSLQEISGHWDAVYEAMRRTEMVDPDETGG
jgi:hypothetical protein